MERKNEYNKKSLFVILIIVLILNLSLIIRFKLTFATITGAGISGIIAIIACLYGRYRKNPKNKGFKYATLTLTFLFLIWSISFIYIGYRIISGIRYSVDGEKYDYIVVLGAGLKGEKMSSVLRQRLEKTVEVLEKNEETMIIVSGGKGPGEDISEASAMKRYLVEKGVGSSRILLEEESTATYENFKFSKKLIMESGNDEPEILVITNDYHLYRAGIMAEKNELKVDGVASRTPIMVRINYLIREYYWVIKSLIY